MNREEKTHWTQDKILLYVKACMSATGLTRMPSRSELSEYYGNDKLTNAIRRFPGGYYKLGNSIALPQWFWIAQKMKPYLSANATLGSLFDGIGGFPLMWETTYGKGTARWASEIEEFPIAVTKRRFGEE